MRALADGDGALGADGEIVGARRALDVVEVEVHRALVAGQQKARQGRGQHHRIAHDHVARGAADLVLAPGHRHDAHGPGEGRNLERDLGLAGAHFDNAGVQRQRRLRRRAAVQFGAGVAAGPDLSARALHAVDELAVEIADLGGELALAEIILVGRRRLVVGQVEDADIDGGHHDAGLIDERQALDLDRHAQGRVRPLQRRQLHVERQRLRLAVDREPLHADRAARHALGLGVERTAQGRHHIGAGAPVGADRHPDARGAGCHLLGDGAQELVAHDVERDAASGARGHGNRHLVAGLVLRLVERDLQHVRRIGARLGVPAGVEAD